MTFEPVARLVAVEVHVSPLIRLANHVQRNPDN